MSSDSTEDIGIVTSVNGKWITVEIAKGGGCKTCGMKGICGINNRPVKLRFETDGQYTAGDKVIVSVTAGIRLLSSLIIFGIPLLAMFGFFLIGRSFTGEPGAVLLAFTGLVLAFLVVRILDRHIGKQVNFRLRGKHEDMPE
jgi:positive regulator of sigma E activity